MIYVIDWVEDGYKKIVYKSSNVSDVRKWVYSHQETFKGVPLAVNDRLNEVKIYDKEGNLLKI